MIGVLAQRVVLKRVDRKSQIGIPLPTTGDKREISIAQDCVCCWLDRQRENKQRNTAASNDNQQENRYWEDLGD